MSMLISTRSRVGRWALAAIACSLALGAWSGCSPAESGSDASASASVTPTPTATESPVLNDMADNSAHRLIPVAGENFDINIDYFCTDYDASKWRTLESKTVHFSVHLVPKAGLEKKIPRVLVTQFQASTTLMATNPGLSGYVVSTSTDNASGVSGYLLTEIYPYEGAISIPGYTTALADQWRSVTGKSGKLDESTLRAAGVYANRITFSFGMVVTNFGDTEGHKRTITDTLTIPSVQP